MPENTPKHRGGRAVAGFLAFSLMTSALLYLFLGDTAVAQRWRMRRAEQHRPVLEQSLASEVRFGQVKVTVFSGAGGSLMVHGVVSSEPDVQALKELVESTKSPVRVVYRVLVALR